MPKPPPTPKGNAIKLRNFKKLAKNKLRSPLRGAILVKKSTK
jgi:hypothetical protein